mgnify:CR=1 FL=1
MALRRLFLDGLYEIEHFMRVEKVLHAPLLLNGQKRIAGVLAARYDAVKLPGLGDVLGEAVAPFVCGFAVT